MAYKPNQIGEEERAKHYNLMWLASGASMLNFANAFIGADSIIVAFAWGFTMSGLFLAAFGSYADEFMRGRLEMAMRFAMGFLVIYLFANWIVNIADIAHSAGYALTAGEAPTPHKDGGKGREAEKGARERKEAREQSTPTKKKR